MDYLMFYGAIITALATIGVAIIQSVTLYRIGQIQVHTELQTKVATDIKTNVDRVEINTNSISERLEKLARDQGFIAGGKAKEDEIALRDKNIATGKKQEQVEQAAKGTPA